MPPAFRHVAWVACIAVAGAGVWSVTARHGDEFIASTPTVSPPAPAVQATLAESAPQLAAAGASTVTRSPLASPAQAVTALPLPFAPADVSRRQREIQIAISSDRRGSAGAAARHIQACQMLEELRDWNEANRQRRGEAAYRRTLGHLAEDLPGCQAVDAASRAQLAPLLRRSLAEGDKGAAASLVTLLRDGFDPAAEPDIVAGLRRDAWVCDGPSMSWLVALTRKHPQLLTPNELGALREKERGWVALSADATRQSGTELDAKAQAALDRVMDSLKLPPGADPAEVARLATDLQRNCAAPP